MNVNIGITDANREFIANELNALLADEFLLYVKTRNAHWNIEGADFYEKHKFLETQFEQLDEIIDDVAERIRTIGHYANASLASFLAQTRLTETHKGANTSADFLKDLLADHHAISIKLRQNANRFANEYSDIGSSDFVTGLLQIHEKMAWFLRSHLK